MAVSSVFVLAVGAILVLGLTLIFFWPRKD